MDRPKLDANTGSAPSSTGGQQPRLPVQERAAEIIELIKHHQVVIIAGATGSGKTTQLPQLALQAGRGASGKVIGHTQPRRLAARSVANRIASEMGSAIGERGCPVGVKVRFTDTTTRDTKIKLMTDGMLLAEAQSDTTLAGYDTVIIDEAHERSLNIDFLLGYLVRLLPKRPDLKLLVTSATIDPARFSTLFGGPSKAPVLEVSGRGYPIEYRYRAPDEADLTRDRDTAINRALVDAAHELCKPRHGDTVQPTGDILVFLPGEREIKLAEGMLRREGPSALEILPLYARLTNAEQDRIFQPPRPGAHTRRIVLATNVAETSLTVPGIRYVIDTGVARIGRYDGRRKLQQLLIEPVSRASADQRAGRCGRMAAGVCIRLFGEDDYAQRPRFTDPEIKRASLANVILQSAALHLGPLEQFAFLDPPDARAIADGVRTLYEIGAIAAPAESTADIELTTIGRSLVRLPLEPRFGRILLEAHEEGCLHEATILCAAMSIQDPRERPGHSAARADTAHQQFRHPDSDFLTLLNIYYAYHDRAGDGDDDRGRGQSAGPSAGQWCFDNFINPARMREWIDTTRQLREICEELDLPFNDKPSGQDAVHRSLMAGLIGTVLCRDDAGVEVVSGRPTNKGFEYNGPRGAKVAIWPGSVLFAAKPKWIVAAELVETSRSYARCCARIRTEWVEEFAAHLIEQSIADVHFDSATGEVFGWSRTTLAGVVIAPRERIRAARVNPVKARQVFIEECLSKGWCPLSLATGYADFLKHNKAALANGGVAMAKLRRRDVMADSKQLTAWFSERIGTEVSGFESLKEWIQAGGKARNDALLLSASDVVKPELAKLLTDDRYPNSITFGLGANAVNGTLSYANSPGKDDDGVTLTLPLRGLAPAALPKFWHQWLVPGMLADLVHGLLKMLPKQHKQALEAKGDFASIASDCADSMVPSGPAPRPPLGTALSETLEILLDIRIPADVWDLKALPDYLKLNLRVIDDPAPGQAKPRVLAENRHVESIRAALAPRLERAMAAAAKDLWQRDGLTTWTWGSLPESVTIEGDAAETIDGEPTEQAATDAPRVMYPAIEDAHRSVSLVLETTRAKADATTRMGIRRLFVLLAHDELDHHFNAMPNWHDHARNYASGHAAMGSEFDLRDELAATICERVFMLHQEPITTQEQFDARQAANWGRLATASIEAGSWMGRFFEPRFALAKRLGSGINRLWANSIADIREQAAYLLPKSWMKYAPAERLPHYARYVPAMRERLFALREDGSGAETAKLAELAPHWKKFTGWVARALLAEQRAAEAAGERLKLAAKRNLPMPKSRRGAPTINNDAAAWAMQPGNLPPAVEAYRWLLEDYRAGLFGTGTPVSSKQLLAAWEKVEALDRPARP